MTQKITKAAVHAVEFSDTSLEGAADTLQAAIALLIESDGPFLSMQVVPCRTTYSQPVEGSHRDDHYVEAGVLVIGFK